MKPFSEVALFEQGNDSDAFYISGSSLSIGEDGSFMTSLKNKVQFKASFIVKNTVQMLPNSCSIYYYNIVNNQWNIPSKSIDDHVGPWDKFSYNTNWQNPSGTISPYYYTNGSYFTEDAKAFDSYGSPIISGSNTVYRNTQSGFAQSNEDLVINQMQTNLPVNLLTKDYQKSTQRSAIYDAENQEVFSIDNKHPFLIEKIVVEIPISFGESWFQDKTMTVLGNTVGSTYQNKTIVNAFRPLFIDQGGPVMTVSLFSQKKYGTSLIRDLIASGTITHSDDANSDTNDLRIITGLNGTPDGVYVYSCGLKESNGSIVSKDVNNQYTGSIIIKMIPGISNGGSAIYSQDISWGDTYKNSYDDIKTYYLNFFGSKQLTNLPDDGGAYNSEGLIINQLDTFGRGSTGFAPSGGSIFGGEYSTGNLSNYKEKNPFYIKDEDERVREAEFIANEVISSSYSYYVRHLGRTSFSYVKPSPYLLDVDENLILSISKTRPSVTSSIFNMTTQNDVDIGKGYLKSYTQATGSFIGHDVSLITGSINITFYGSYVRANKEYIP